MKKIFLIILFSNFILSDNNLPEKPPEFKLGDIPIDLDIDLKSAIPDSKQEDLNKLSDFQIEDIKLKAKHYIPSDITSSDIIIIHTNKGKIKFKFYSEAAPKHCYNFKKLANSGFYDETLVHSVIPDFIIQAGDVLTRNFDELDDGFGGPGWTIDAEFNNLKHRRGILSMSRSVNNPNSAGSQFFICLDNLESLDGKYTIFGYLIEGDYVLSSITKVASEHKQGIMLTKSDIPEGEDASKWVEVIDSKTQKERYAKVPDFINKNDYQQSVQKKLNNIYKPGSPIMIDSIRVINENIK